MNATISPSLAAPWSVQPARIALSAVAPGGGGQAPRTVATERQIHEMLCSDVPEKRALALRHINAVARRFTEVLLSSVSAFPSQQTQGEADKMITSFYWGANDL